MKESRVFAAADESMDAVNDFIHSFVPDTCAADVLLKLDLAVEEIFVNIAHYSGAADAEVICEMADGVLSVCFTDSGSPFNPLSRPDPDPTASIEERRIGGWGIFLTKKYMDRVTYDYAGGKNVLTITKTL